jgi:hypothetical protein
MKLTTDLHTAAQIVGGGGGQFWEKSNCKAPVTSVIINHKELNKLAKFKSDFTYMVFNITFLSGKSDFDNA